MTVQIPPTHKAIKHYHATLADIEAQDAWNEGATRDAFSALLRELGGRQPRKWTLLAEQTLQTKRYRIRVDGVMNDPTGISLGYWEAKDSADDLDAEIDKKIAREYPLTNIIFEDTRTGVLFQNKKRVGTYDLQDAAQLADMLARFFDHTEPAVEEFYEAMNVFMERVPGHADDLRRVIAAAHKDNPKFKEAFGLFVDLIKQSLNPQVSKDDVDEMLIQHLLTERIIRNVFDLPEFAHRNVIAAEVEKVIGALTSQHWSRKDFLGQLDYFYSAIEKAARTLDDFYQKQTFLNHVYERFFQGYAVKTADVLGIVYTPDEIIDFMNAAVEEVLIKDFGLSLAHEDVHIIDPCTGTGKFIVNLLKRLDARYKPHLKDVYAKRLFANEIALMPYYIASLNIEQAYHELTGESAAFEGLCLVDTLGLADSEGMLNLFAEENTDRIERQRNAPITVIIGNPPYNVGQQNENDNNKNRKYKVVDEKLRATYAAASTAGNKNHLSDAYVKFWRWATDRLQDRDGIVAFVSNNSFVDQIAFDGMRKHLMQDFTRIYHLDLHGNVRQNPKISGTSHNVFGIQVGVGVTIAIKSAQHADRKLFYHRVPEMWRARQKLDWLNEHVEREGRENSLNTINWEMLAPDNKDNWIAAANAGEFSTFLPIGTKEGRNARGFDEPEVVFKLFSPGLQTNRDDVVHDFDSGTLVQRIQQFIEEYNSEVDRYTRAGRPQNIDDFVRYDRIKWSSSLKQHLARGSYANFHKSGIRTVSYRPYMHQFAYFDSILNHRQGQFPRIFPTPNTENENRVICVPGLGHRAPWACLITQVIPNLSLTSIDAFQCFPFYVYNEDGTHRRENITDWALGQFRQHYADDSIGKWDIFYYVYAVLHHPLYRSRYKDALKKELPRIPFVPRESSNPGPTMDLTPGPSPEERGETHAGFESPSLRERGSGAPATRGEVGTGETHAGFESPSLRERGSGAPATRGEVGTGETHVPDTKAPLLGRGVWGEVQNQRGSGAPATRGEVGWGEVGSAEGDLGGEGFWAFSRIGKALADLHLNYESVDPYPLTDIWTPGKPASYRVEKMKWNKDKSALTVNDSLRLEDVPAEAFRYMLGNRSALDWVVDQYQVKTDKRSGIVSDPNKYADDPRYIVDLVKRVTTVSVRTVALVDQLESLPLLEGVEAEAK